MEGKPLECPLCNEAETFADQLEREMGEADDQFAKARDYAASLGEGYLVQLEAAIAKRKGAKP